MTEQCYCDPNYFVLYFLRNPYLFPRLRTISYTDSEFQKVQVVESLHPHVTVLSIYTIQVHTFNFLDTLISRECTSMSRCYRTELLIPSLSKKMGTQVSLTKTFSSSPPSDLKDQRIIYMVLSLIWSEGPTVWSNHRHIIGNTEKQLSVSVGVLPVNKKLTLGYTVSYESSLLHRCIVVIRIHRRYRSRQSLSEGTDRFVRKVQREKFRCRET